MQDAAESQRAHTKLFDVASLTALQAEIDTTRAAVKADRAKKMALYQITVTINRVSPGAVCTRPPPARRGCATDVTRPVDCHHVSSAEQNFSNTNVSIHKTLRLLLQQYQNFGQGLIAAFAQVDGQPDPALFRLALADCFMLVNKKVRAARVATCMW